MNRDLRGRPQRRAALPGIEAILNQQQAPAQRRLGGRAHQLRDSSHPSSSSTLSEVRSATTTTTPSASGHSSTDIRSSNSGPARMQTTYKPQTKVTKQLRATKSTRGKSSVTGPSRPARTTRYLRKEDRRDIVRRIANGEKQSDLTKEFQVSRTAISNIKQRHNRMKELQQQQQQSGLGSSEQDGSGDNYVEETARCDGVGSDCSQVGELHESRQCQDPQHHPDRSEYKLHQFEHRRAYCHSNNSMSESETECPLPDRPRPALQISQLPMHDDMKLFERVTEMATTSMELLFTRLVGPCTDAHTFQVALSRIARLLLEHVLSEFSTREVRIPVASASGPPNSYYLGTEILRRSCAVTASTACDGAEDYAPALLEAFQAIEPRSGYGFVASRSTGDGYDVKVPRNIRERNVVLLVKVLDTQSSRHAAKATLECGVQQESIVLVTLAGEERALMRVLEAFPGLRVVASKILSQGGAEPSSGAEICSMLRASLVYKGQPT